MKKLAVFIFASFTANAQVPVASFSVSPNPACAQAMVQLTDQSSGSPTSWLYSISGQGPGAFTLAAQNPTFAFNNPGIYTISLVASNASGSSAPQTQTVQVFPSPVIQVSPNAINTCSNGSPVVMNVMFTGPGGGGYSFLWSTGATSPSLQVSPTVTSVYSVVVTNTFNCSVQKTATVTVGPATVNISSVPVNICPGTSSTLTATGTQPGPFSYTWAGGPTTRTLATSVAGVYTVTATNGNGCVGTQTYNLGTSSTLSLSTIVNPTVLCAGNTATIRATGAASYSWSTGSTAVNTTVNPVSATTYTVYGTFASCTGSAAVTVSVNTTPTVAVASTPATLCAGSSATLSASGADTYTWLTVGAGSSVIVTPSVTTSFTVLGSNPGCFPNTKVVSVQVSPVPVVNISSNASVVCAGEAVALAATGADTYSWTNGATGGVVIVYPVQTSTFGVTGTSSSGCIANAIITQSVDVCERITQETTGHLSFFPNPATHLLTISSAGASTYRISDLTGRLLLSGIIDASGSTRIDVAQLARGVYLVSVGNGPATRLVLR